MQRTPLAERIRPQNLDDIVGQEHLVSEQGLFRKILKTGIVPSMILWGPPGVGKTTIANIISNTVNLPFYNLSAISSGVKDIREVIQRAKMNGKVILFIDEIHRFNKAQQDALLASVEKGWVVLIGATTENPSFEVNSALLSRCQVYVLKPMTEQNLKSLLHKAIEKDTLLKEKKIYLKEYEALIRLSGGDARKLLNLLEMAFDSSIADELTITDELVMDVAQKNIALYDKSGEQHYDIISAFIKSVRGSDPNAAVYWLSRMLAGGEDIKFIARRMIILASEDIGNANPTALVLATNTFQAVQVIGMPEARIILSQCATYLASSAKSNASYVAINDAMQVVNEKGGLPVPLHIRNAPTKLMKDLNYGKGYQYSHDYENNFSGQEYLPDEIRGTKFYDPGNNARENELRKRLKSLWQDKYRY